MATKDTDTKKADSLVRASERVLAPPADYDRDWRERIERAKRVREEAIEARKSSRRPLEVTVHGPI